MNPKLFLLIALFLPLLGNSQIISNVNFDEIKTTIQDKDSHLFYPKLVERILDLDTTLTSEEFKHLYYGNVFQDNYYPYGATELQKEFNEAYKREGLLFEKKEKLGMKVLNENPVNLQVLLKMIFLYNGQKKMKQATVFAKIYVSFLEVIYASGTGKECDAGFVVITVDDEYRIAGDLGLEVVQQALIGSCDRLVFSRKGQKRKSRIKELYFNVRIPLTYLSKSFDQPDLPEAEAEEDEKEDN